jgi:hypothetical protein
MALGRKTGGRQRGTPNKRTVGLRLAQLALAAGETAAPFDALAHLRAIAQYFLDEAETERRKAKPCERVIIQSLERAARVLAEILPYEHPKLSAVKLGGDPNAPLNLSELSDDELVRFRRLMIKISATNGVHHDHSLRRQNARLHVVDREFGTTR